MGLFLGAKHFVQGGAPTLYAGGMTIRGIQHHLAATLGTELGHETISNVTKAVAEEVAA